MMYYIVNAQQSAIQYIKTNKYSIKTEVFVYIISFSRAQQSATNKQKSVQSWGDQFA